MSLLRRDVDRLYRGSGARAPRVRAAPPGAEISSPRRSPIGAGLSSSAALTVSAAKALSLLAGKRLSRRSWPRWPFAQNIIQVGSAAAAWIRLSPRMASEDPHCYSRPPTAPLQRVPFTGRLWIVETGLSHRLTGGSLNQRRRSARRRWRSAAIGGPARALAQLRPATCRRWSADCLHRWSAGAPCRHRDGAHPGCRRALAAGDLERLGRLLVEGHESLRLDYESTIPEADLIVESAVQPTERMGLGSPAPAGEARWWCWRRLSERARIVADIAGDFQAAVWPLARRPGARARQPG